jgi:hypothetical protein
LREAWLIATVLLLTLIAAPRALAQGPVNIQSAGPLTNIWIAEDLTCQVQHTGEDSYQFYSPTSITGSCGTMLSANGELFGFRGSFDWDTVSQTGVMGAGTAQSPYQVTTLVRAAENSVPVGLQLTETDSYVAGNEYYRTDMTVTNTSPTGAAFANLRLYHAADCYLQGSDSGYGFVDSSNGAIACTQNPNNSPPALIEEFAPLVGGSHFVEGHYSQMYSDVAAQTDLPDTCDCTTIEDNGMAINWDMPSLGPGQSHIFSMLSSFSPTGITSFPISATGGNPLSGTVSTPVTGTVASFTDPDSSDPASDFSSTIAWGDGTSSTGAVSGGGGTFIVNGSHTYTAPGSYTITVTINRLGSNPSTTTATDSAAIAGAPTPVVTAAPTVGATGAGFSGSINPSGLLTTAVFQYDLDPKYAGGGPLLYGHSTPAQTVGSDLSSHAVTASVSGLVPNALYHVRLVATNSAGTTAGPDVTFTTLPGAPPGSPTLGQSFNIAPVSGVVLIKVNGVFVPLTELKQIPENTVINALHGTLTLITAGGGPSGARDAAAKNGKKHKPTINTQKGTFGGAIFKIAQATGGASKGLATLTLVEGAFKGAPSYALCKKGGKKKAGDASAAAASSKTLQLLHASAKGKFKTTGKYSAATVRGTKWTIADRCDGTVTHDVTDSVAVTDFVRHKTIILHAGQTYLAKASGKK